MIGAFPEAPRRSSIMPGRRSLRKRFAALYFFISPLYRRGERIGPRQAPGVAPLRVARAGQKLAFREAGIELGEGHHFMGRDAPAEMLGLKIVRVVEARRGGELGERMQGRAMEIVDAFGLVGDVKGARAARILRGHAGRAAIGVATERLDAAEREHEAARRIAPIGAE